MQIRQVKMGDLKELWESLYYGNEYLTPYSSYEFNRTVCRYYRFALKRALFTTKIFQVIDDDLNPIMIIPLYGRGHRFYIIGDLMMTGHLDFIYKSDIRDGDFEQALLLLQTELKGSKLVLNKISERSRLNDYLGAKYPIKKREICVNAYFGRDFDSYTQSLSKNMRKNIRVIYNRLEHEAVNWEVKVITNTHVPQEYRRDFLRLYSTKYFDKNGKKPSWLLRANWYYTNPLTLNLMKMEGNLNSFLIIDGKIVAAVGGFFTSDGSTVIMPRSAMDRSYAQFRPGILIDLETIKWLVLNSSVSNYDMSRGGEAYKYALGGKEHYNYSYEIDL